MTCCKGIESGLTSSGFGFCTWDISTMSWGLRLWESPSSGDRRPEKGAHCTLSDGGAAGWGLWPMPPRLDPIGRSPIVKGRMAISGQVSGPREVDRSRRTAILNQFLQTIMQGERRRCENDG